MSNMNSYNNFNNNNNTTAEPIFDLLSKIDEGSFGHVFLVEKRGGPDDAKQYAMKLVYADGYTEREFTDAFANEFNIFKAVHDAPFLMQMKYALKKATFFFFVLEYAPVGNMYQYLRAAKRMQSADVIICAMELIEAIGYLHQHKIIYRDLKLENILIGDDGHIMLTDFGLARQLQHHERLYDSAGTYIYMAPELIDICTGHSYEVDWWAVAVLVHELLTGHSPFVHSADEGMTEQMYKKRVLKSEPCFQHIKEHAALTDLLRRLLVKDEDERLGFGRDGHLAVKQHRLFSGLSWNALKLKMYNGLPSVPRKRTSKRLASCVSLKVPVLNEYSYAAPELSTDQPTERHSGFTAADLEAADRSVPVAEPDIHLYPNRSTYLRCKPTNVVGLLAAMFPQQDDPDEPPQESVQSKIAPAVQSTSVQPTNKPKELPQRRSSRPPPLRTPKLASKSHAKPPTAHNAHSASALLRTNGAPTNPKATTSYALTSVQRTDSSPPAPTMRPVSVMLRRLPDGQGSVQSRNTPAVQSTSSPPTDAPKEMPPRTAKMTAKANGKPAAHTSRRPTNSKSTILQPSNANAKNPKVNKLRQAKGAKNANASASGRQMRAVSVLLRRHSFRSPSVQIPKTVEKY